MERRRLDSFVFLELGFCECAPVGGLIGLVWVGDKSQGFNLKAIFFLDRGG